jgi:hypothetical protein
MRLARHRSDSRLRQADSGLANSSRNQSRTTGPLAGNSCDPLLLRLLQNVGFARPSPSAARPPAPSGLRMEDCKDMHISVHRRALAERSCPGSTVGRRGLAHELDLLIRRVVVGIPPAHAGWAGARQSVIAGGRNVTPPAPVRDGFSPGPGPGSPGRASAHVGHAAQAQTLGDGAGTDTGTQLVVLLAAPHFAPHRRQY